MHHPEKTGTAVAMTLNDTTGPKATVIGAATAAGRYSEGFASPLTPPIPAFMAWVKKGLWPWRIAHGSHCSHHSSWEGSPHGQVIDDDGLPVTQTRHHRRTATAR